ncbi:MAG TPA: hypothetical protein VGG75_09635 [Trebonia sp.]|jgi:hypothetical protein
MPTTSRADGGAHDALGEPDAPADAVVDAADGANGAPGEQASPPRFWSTPAFMIIAAATVIGLALRAFLLFTPGFLTSGTVEYDDGVYLGAAIQLLHGSLPYSGYAFVQPPGILIIALPFAVIAHFWSTAAGLAAARVVTVVVSAVAIPLVGRLVRHKGPLVMVVTCGFFAVYPADILTARTLLLEPWMNLLCLLAANAAFSRGRLASPRRLAWAGVALGFATAVKFWAGAPAIVLLACCLLTGEQRARRVRCYVPAAIVGFVIPVAALAGDAPLAFIRSTVFDQAARLGESTPLNVRAAYLTGVMDIINAAGKLSWFPGVKNSALAAGSTGIMINAGIGITSGIVALVVLAVIFVAYFRRPRSRSPLEWFAFGVAALATVGVSAYSAFFYHYPDFPAPWLAIVLGVTAGAACGALGRVSSRGIVLRVATGLVAVAVIAVAVLEGTEMSGVTTPDTPQAIERLIPKGSCVFSDQVSFTLAADRFRPSEPGCPAVMDSLATTLVNGGSDIVPGSDVNNPQVTATWEKLLGHTQYVWLTSGYWARIPWSTPFSTWFWQHYRKVATFPGYGNSGLYERYR